ACQGTPEGDELAFAEGRGAGMRGGCGAAVPALRGVGSFLWRRKAAAFYDQVAGRRHDLRAAGGSVAVLRRSEFRVELPGEQLSLPGGESGERIHLLGLRRQAQRAGGAGGV